MLLCGKAALSPCQILRGRLAADINVGLLSAVDRKIGKRRAAKLMVAEDSVTIRYQCSRLRVRASLGPLGAVSVQHPGRRLPIF